MELNGLRNRVRAFKQGSLECWVEEDRRESWRRVEVTTVWLSMTLRGWLFHAEGVLILETTTGHLETRTKEHSEEQYTWTPDKERW
jgi:hypothetical protein